MQHFMKIILFSFAILISTISVSWSTMPESLLCFEATRKVEAEYNIPPHILSAIALTESGRTNNYNKTTKIRTPWPWTANIGGAGRYFKSRTEALLTFKQLIARQNNMFDVGCMQINWHYHKEAFNSIEEALDPYYNVQYAAEFLTSLYERTGSWTKAVERYHSATPKHYQRYRQAVASNWDNARDLMSPIDGRLNALLLQNTYDKFKISDNRKIETIKANKIARMREIAKLRARVREYAQSNY
jgi:soluble lytic murein transglycosylase-like protein